MNIGDNTGMLKRIVAASVLTTIAFALSACQREAEIVFEQVDKEPAGILLEASDASMSKSTFRPLRTVSEEGILLLKEYEGEVKCTKPTEDRVHCPYNDSSNFCTIGHGHLIDGRKSCESIRKLLKEQDLLLGISEAQAEEILRNDLWWAQRALENRMDAGAENLGTTELTGSQYDALVSFIFNVGAANFESSTLLKRLEARARIDGNSDIANQFTRWTRSNGSFVQGLLNRRNREVDHFFKGFERPLTEKSMLESEIDIRVGETESP